MNSTSMMLIITLLAQVISTTRAHNTNECLAAITSMAVCEETNWIGLPTRECCRGLKEIIVNDCECTPVLAALAGEFIDQLGSLEFACRVQPALWDDWFLVPWVRSCPEDFDTFNYGCEESDAQIDANRVMRFLNFHTTMDEFMDDESATAAECFDLDALAESLRRAGFTDSTSFNVPYGVGKYVGPVDTAEYFALVSPALNHGFWVMRPDLTDSSMNVSEDGLIWDLANTINHFGIHSRFQFPGDYTTRMYFEGCADTTSRMDVVATEGVLEIAKYFALTAPLSKRFGIEDICRYHTEYCASDNATRQYDSEEDCIEYISSLPAYTETCGMNRPMSGNSMPCKLKHHFMVPANAPVHCAHIGPAGAIDINGNLKCDDVYECTADVGQDSWPQMYGLDGPVPADIQAVFDEDNIGWEDEELGCVV